MDKKIGGKRGRRNGNGDLIQRKINCGLTENGKALYEKLFPGHEDFSKISIKRHYETITYQLGDCDNSGDTLFSEH